MIDLIFLFIFILLISLAIISDVRHLVIPNWLSIALVATFAVYATFFATSLPVLQHVLVAGGVFAVGFLLFAVRWFAAGDVKLISAVALWAGPSQIPQLLLLTTSLGALLGISVLAIQWISARQAAAGIPSVLTQIAPRWARRGLCPYGLAIGIAALSLVPSRFF